MNRKADMVDLLFFAGAILILVWSVHSFSARQIHAIESRLTALESARPATEPAMTDDRK